MKPACSGSAWRTAGLPLQQQPRKIAMSAVLHPFETASHPGLSQRRVLLVEDNAFITELLRLMLNQHCEVLLASDAASGLTLAQRERPDLVITDLCFGTGMNGHQLLQAMRADAVLAHTPVLVISAHASQADVETSLALGAQAHIGKPFSPLHLLRWLDRLWDAASAARPAGKPAKWGRTAH